MNHTLNLAPLQEPLTQADINAYRLGKSHRKALFGSLGKKMSVVPMVLIGLWTLYLSILANNASFALFFISIFGVVLFFFWLSYKRVVKLRARLFKFAQANGLSFVEDVVSPSYPGMIFHSGHTRRIEEAFWFSDGIEIGNYAYDEGSGRNRHTYKWGYVKIKLNRRLPHMILDAKANNFWKFSSLSGSFDRSQVLKLEGDFNSYFTLYAPQAYARDALYVFTPDVMAAMIDHGKNFDIEIVDDQLFIYSATYFPLDNPALYGQLLTIVTTLRSELLDQTDYYADERVGNRVMNVVASEGQRLKSGTSWLIWVIVAVVAYFVFLPFFFP